MRYVDLIQIGMVRRNYYDQVFMDQTGYEPFDVSFTRENISLVWTPTSPNEVKFYINDKIYKKLYSLGEVKEIINLFNN